MGSSSLTRDPTQALALEMQSFNHWTTREVLRLCFFCLFVCLSLTLDFLGGSDGRASDYNVGDPGSILGLGRSSGEGNGNSLQYSCLENPMDGGAW